MMMVMLMMIRYDGVTNEDADMFSCVVVDDDDDDML